MSDEKDRKQTTETLGFRRDGAHVIVGRPRPLAKDFRPSYSPPKKKAD